MIEQTDVVIINVHPVNFNVFTTGAKSGTSDKEIDLFISKLREVLTRKDTF